MTRFHALMVSFFMTTTTTAQIIKPYAFGDTVNNLEFKNIVRYNRNSATLADYAGKVVVLDFWATWCGPCVAGMPKLDTLQKKFGDKLFVLPVSSEKEETITTFFKRASMKHLGLPSIARDSILKKKFPFATIPHAVIIDRKGKIVALTSSDKIDSSILAKVWNGEKIDLVVKKARPTYNRHKSLLLNTETIAEFPPIFSSTLVRSIFGLPSTASELFDEKGATIGMTYFNTTLVQLYLSGFEEPEHYQSSRIYLENISDPDFFIRDRSRGSKYFRAWGETHTYCYDIVAPGLTRAERKRQMVHDLNNAFGVEAFMAEREVDCYLLQRIKPAPRNWKDMRGSVTTDFDHKFVKLYNARPAQLADYLDKTIYVNRPVFDDTGDSIPVNGKFNRASVLHVRDTRDISMLVRELNTVGFTLTPARRTVNVLVIRRKKS